MPTLAEILSSPALAYQEYQKPLSERMYVSSQERDLIEQLALKYYKDIVQGGAQGTYAQQVAAVGSAYSAYDQIIVQQALNTVAIPVPGIGIPATVINNGIGSGSGGGVLLLLGAIALALVLLGGKK